MATPIIDVSSRVYQLYMYASFKSRAEGIMASSCNIKHQPRSMADLCKGII